MTNSKNFIKIQNLFVNFYTKSGVVKAIDGVDLEIMHGETFGLVGESGCGKSVTANSIMRIIQSPPGKIESGRILVELPDELYSRLKDIEERQENGESEESINRSLAELNPELDKYDILKLPQYKMRRIRGKKISMIFQEPMIALNPVFTIGNQITEILLLHEMKDLVEATLRNLEGKGSITSEIEGPQGVQDEDGDLKCHSCGSTIIGRPRNCPYCGMTVRKKSGKGLPTWQLNYYKRVYKTMVVDQDDLFLKLLGKIPILNSYKKPLMSEANGRAIRMLRLVRIPDPGSIIKNFPHELSGGMQQRVMIAMALACKPQLLIADEPTTALDVTIQAQILKLMRELQEEMGTSILMITHNLGVVAEICERIGVMYAGNIVEVGSTETIFAEPLHPYTQGLINSIPNVNANTERLEVITGSVPNLIKPPTGCRFHPRCPFAMPICNEVKPLLERIGPDHHVACHLYGKVKRNE